MEHIVVAEGIGHAEGLAWTSHSSHGDRLVGHVGWCEIEIAGDDVGLLCLEHELEALVVAVEECNVLLVGRTIFHLEVVTHVSLDDCLLDTDCVSDELLDYLEALNRRTFVLVEYGIESANDETLKRINRGHDFACCRDAVERTHARGILTGAHIIIGLPGEDAAESLRQAPIISSLPIDILKIHQMQIIKGTRLAQEYAEHPFHVYTVEEYIDVIVKYIRLLRKDLVLERFVSQSPKELLVAPKWGLKNYEFTNLLNNKLKSLQ